MSKTFKPKEVAEALKKSLTEKMEKASPVLRAILNDIGDKNSVAELPPEEIPTDSKQNVLNKQAEAGVQQPIKSPQLKNNVPPNIGAMQQRAETGGMGGNQGPKKPKGPLKLQTFMKSIEGKRSSPQEEVPQIKVPTISLPKSQS